MPIWFNSLLQAVNINLKDVRLIRHTSRPHVNKVNPYRLWIDNKELFEQYQSIQTISNFTKLNTNYWAAFLPTPADEVLFIGLYHAEYEGVLQHDMPSPQGEGVEKAGTVAIYRQTLLSEMSEYIGRLTIDWGKSERAWIQRADKQNKRILELRKEFKEPDFPGFLHFIEPLSRISMLPSSWIAVLESARGIYLLTCPKSKEQYIGSAYGEHGFWGRWQSYLQTGHGGNIGLRNREPSDYQVSILEVVGSSHTINDIIEIESRWKKKLQSREMGLNRN